MVPPGAPDSLVQRSEVLPDALARMYSSRYFIDEIPEIC
jgi:hypothetical protein